MDSALEFIKNNITTFDLVVVLITIYSMTQCATKGFTLSLLSFSKWLIALIVTIVLVPNFSPFLEDYIESKFVADIGLGIFIFMLALFITINIGKAISSTITWSGLGMVDKTFGLIFGIFKGYIICVCIFSLSNWFYPHEKWPIATEDTYSFPIIFSGSRFFINELPNSEDYLEDTKNKIEDI